MKTLAVFLFSLFLVASAEAQRITASITVTNITTNGMTFTVNGNVRTFTNVVFQSNSQILTNADVFGGGSKTNLFNQIALNPYSQVIPLNVSSNAFSLVGSANAALIVTASAGWASVSYSTQAVSGGVVVTIPVTIESAAEQTNIASGIVQAINLPANTNTISQSSKAAGELLGTNKTQTVYGATTLNNTNNQIFGIVSSLGISGNSVMLTNGLYFTPILSSPVFSNAVNYGTAFSSPGIGTGSEQYGIRAAATNVSSVSIGEDSIAGGFVSSAIGGGAVAIGLDASAFGGDADARSDYSTAIGASSEAHGTNALAVGVDAEAETNNSTALGTFASATFTNSTAIGANASTTAANQVMLGAGSSSVVVPNNLSVLNNENVANNISVAGNFSAAGLTTNATYTGTNNYKAGSDIAYARFPITSLANGNNAAIPVGTNVFIEVSGPSASFTINGINAAGAMRDGKEIIIANQTGFQMTIANESGTDPTAANRIRTLGSATDLVLTNAIVKLIYSGNNSRWLVESHNP